MALSVILAFAIALIGFGSTQEVNTPNGRLRGTVQESQNGKPFHQFIGVQYAIIPGRFDLSTPVLPWEGVKDAVAYGPRCDLVGAFISEDCLYLNVFAPPLDGSVKHPVVVYIHGGGFQANSNQEFGPNYFMNKDVVLVVIQYRLGILGFLSTGDEYAPGNNGLKDQVMALKWVQANIESFGGDKDKVTLMGQSAGGAAVTYHILSPMSRDLFHHAIVQSGTFMDPWALSRTPTVYAERLAIEMDCPTTSMEMVACLKTIPLSQLTDYCTKRKIIIKWHEEPGAVFGPVIEPSDGPTATTFLKSNPYALLQDGDFYKVPVLTGVVKEEGVYLWSYFINYYNGPKPCGEEGTPTYPWLNDIQANWSEISPAIFYFGERVPADRIPEVSQKIRDFYFQDGPIDSTTFYNLARAYSDRHFVNSAMSFVSLYSAHAPTYPYLYTFNKYWGIEFNTVAGFPENIDQAIEATHAAELDMLFSPLYGQTRNTWEHNEMSASMMNLWYSFIKNGSPTEAYGTAQQFPVAASGLKVPDIKWYQLDTDTTLVNNMFIDRNAFWNALPINDTNLPDFKENGASRLGITVWVALMLALPLMML